MLSKTEKHGGRRGSPLPIYLILEGVSALVFQLIVTIYVVYYATTVGLDALQIVLIGTVFEATIFLFEIPTGVIADVYSRRLSIIIGVALSGAALLVEGLLPTFVAIVLAEIVAGIGATFISGATEAWIADEVGEARAGYAYVRGAQVRQVAGIAGIVVSVALASAQLSLPFVVAGGLFVGLALFLLAFMPENGFQPTPRAERDSWRTLFATFRQGVKLIRLRPALVVILAIGFIYAFHSEGFDLLWQKHILDNFVLPALGALDPVVWFGIIGLGANALTLVLSEVIRRRVDLRAHGAAARRSLASLLLAIYALLPLGIFAFSLTSNFGAALAAYWLVMALRGAGEPVGKAWLNQHFEPGIRATMFSISSQIGAFGEIAGGAPIGALGRSFGLRAALAASGAIVALTLPLFGVALRREKTVVEE